MLERTLSETHKVTNRRVTDVEEDAVVPQVEGNVAV
jgi:hypothetical protein